MLMRMYSLYDSKTEAYIPPFYSKAKGDAIRQITQVINDANSKHDFAKYPEDFTLFELGVFDDSTGIITPHMVNENMGCLVNFKQSDSDVN